MNNTKEKNITFVSSDYSRYGEYSLHWNEEIVEVVSQGVIVERIETNTPIDLMLSIMEEYQPSNETPRNLNFNKAASRMIRAKRVVADADYDGSITLTSASQSKGSDGPMFKVYDKGADQKSWRKLSSERLNDVFDAGTRYTVERVDHGLRLVPFEDITLANLHNQYEFPVVSFYVS